MSNTKTSIIVLRNDSSTAWEGSSYILLKGELGVSYDGDKAVIKIGNGKSLFKDLPEISNSNLTDYYTKSQIDELIAKIPGSPDLNLDNYYTKDETYNKSEIDQKISEIEHPSVDLSNYYTKSEVDNLIPEVDLSNYYTQDEVDSLLANIDIPDINLSDYYTRAEIDSEISELDEKIDQLSGTDLSNYYTKSEVDAKLDACVVQEPVMDHDIVLTHSFGKYQVPSGGFLSTPSTGKTLTQWVEDALKEVKDPVITQPSVSLTTTIVTDSGDFEIGSQIKAVTYAGSQDVGKYQIDDVVQSTGLDSSDFSWTVTCDKSSETRSDLSGSFPIDKDTLVIDEEFSKVYANVAASVNVDASDTNIPVNNIGEETSGKIETQTITKSTNVSAKGFRKPFWGVIASGGTIKSPEAYESSDVRSLPGKGTSTRDVPTKLIVPVNSQQVLFFVKSNTYTSLRATDGNAMNAPVVFTKATNPVSVKGFNNFEETEYDLWYVAWGQGISVEKNLSLTWS